MVSDFRKKKFLHIFHVIFDADRSGFVEKADFDLALERIATKRGYKPGDIPYGMVSDLLKAIWRGLEKEGDPNGDGKISTEEWVAMWDKFTQDMNSEKQKLYMKSIFTLLDSAHDGSVDENEFAEIFETFGRDKQKSIEAFKKLSGGKGKITESEFETLWKEYFKSENPEDNGNMIFSYFD